jgi:hypothetical protein
VSPGQVDHYTRDWWHTSTSAKRRPRTPTAAKHCECEQPRATITDELGTRCVNCAKWVSDPSAGLEDVLGAGRLNPKHPAGRPAPSTTPRAGRKGASRSRAFAAKRAKAPRPGGRVHGKRAQ